MKAKKNEISKLGTHLSSLFIDIEQLEMDLQLLKSSIGRMKNTFSELELLANRLNSSTEKSKLKMNQLIDIYLHKIESGDINLISQSGGEAPAAKPDPSSQQRTSVEIEKPSSAATVPAVGQHGGKSKNDTTGKAGVMIFISPENKRFRELSGDSTCVPRRQLLPTVDEEKMILEYLIRTDHKPTQDEYNNLFKEVCNMLISAPRNAIAIELRTAGPKSKTKYIELFYHIKVRNKLDFACLKYIEIEGVNAYRQKKAKVKH
jgi:hypothetical protein